MSCFCEQFQLGRYLVSCDSRGPNQNIFKRALPDILARPELRTILDWKVNDFLQCIFELELGKYSKLSIIRPGCSRLLQFEKKWYWSFDRDFFKNIKTRSFNRAHKLAVAALKLNSMINLSWQGPGRIIEIFCKNSDQVV